MRPFVASLSLLLALVSPCALVAPTHAAPPKSTTPTPKSTAYAPPPIPIDWPVRAKSGKVEAALLTEIATLEQQLKKLPETSDDHAKTAWKLASDYSELAASKSASYDAATTKADKAKARALHEKARDRVIELHRLIIDKHDTLATLDEVIYFLAREYELWRQFDSTDATEIKAKRAAKEKALATYLELIKKSPQSTYVTWAYLAYGDLYFEEAVVGKIDWKLPLEAYARVTQGDPATTKAWGYAQFRMGFVHWNLGDALNAKSAFKKSEQFGTKYPAVSGAAELVTESQKAQKAL